MKNMKELMAAMDEDTRKTRKTGNPEGAKVVIALADTIRARVRLSGLRGKAAEKMFYKLFNKATDPYGGK